MSWCLLFGIKTHRMFRASTGKQKMEQIILGTFEQGSVQQFIKFLISDSCWNGEFLMFQATWELD